MCGKEERCSYFRNRMVWAERRKIEGREMVEVSNGETSVFFACGRAVMADTIAGSGVCVPIDPSCGKAREVLMCIDEKMKEKMDIIV